VTNASPAWESMVAARRRCRTSHRASRSAKKSGCRGRGKVQRHVKSMIAALRHPFVRLINNCVAANVPTILAQMGRMFPTGQYSCRPACNLHERARNHLSACYLEDDNSVIQAPCCRHHVDARLRARVATSMTLTLPGNDMKPRHLHAVDSPKQARWLKTYYFSRAGFSIAWVAAVFAVGRYDATAAACLFLIYPLWDAGANLVDARQSGGLRNNLTQTLNAAVSLLTTVGVAVALEHSMNAALVVFGAWASLSGLLQLATAARRWNLIGAQWAMILSGLQSALAGAHFISRGLGAEPHGIAVITPYAAFGAFYFLVSALWLVVSGRRTRKAATGKLTPPHSHRLP
jgi:uncharacterized membrane protein HdeD (DUF308 family)